VNYEDANKQSKLK